MKLPRTKNRYCPKCKKHTEHKIVESRKKTPFTAHPMSYGSKPRQALRGRMHMGNRGKYSRPPISKWKMAGKKQSKKTDFRFQCSQCKKMHTQDYGIRTRKVEFV